MLDCELFTEQYGLCYFSLFNYTLYSVFILQNKQTNKQTQSHKDTK